MASDDRAGSVVDAVEPVGQGRRRPQPDLVQPGGDFAALDSGIEAAGAARAIDGALREIRAEQQIAGMVPVRDSAESVGFPVKGVMNVENGRAVAVIGSGDGAVMGGGNQARPEIDHGEDDGRRQLVERRQRRQRATACIGATNLRQPFRAHFGPRRIGGIGRGRGKAGHPFAQARIARSRIEQRQHHAAAEQRGRTQIRTPESQFRRLTYSLTSLFKTMALHRY